MFGGITLTPKELMTATLECNKEVDGIPLWELEFHLWDKFSNQHIVLGREFIELSKAEKEKALHKNAEIILFCAEKLNFSAITVPTGYWEIAHGEPAYYWLPEEERLMQAKILKDYVGDSRMLIANTGGVMAMPSADCYVDFCYQLFDAPEDIDILAKQIFANGIRSAKLYQEIGIDAVITASDLADNRGLFFNPEQMKRYILPYLNQWAYEMKKLGLYTIFHSDGNLDMFMDDIVESGVNALQAIDPIAGMDIVTTKKKVGERLCLCGNIDCGLLLAGEKEEIYINTLELLISLKSECGFVLGASNAIQQEVEQQNYQAMNDAWRRFL